MSNAQEKLYLRLGQHFNIEKELSTDVEYLRADLVPKPMTDEEIRKAFEEFFSMGPRNTRLYRRDVEAPEEYFVDFIQERFWGWQAAFEFMRKRNG